MAALRPLSSLLGGVFRAAATRGMPRIGMRVPTFALTAAFMATSFVRQVHCAPGAVAAPVCNDDVCAMPSKPVRADPGKGATHDAIKDVLLTGPWPLQTPHTLSDWWKDGPALILVVRRLGCPLCRHIVGNVLAEKSKFDALGVKIVLTCSQDIGADAFIQDVWKGQELHIDKEDQIRAAMGGGCTRRGGCSSPRCWRRHCVARGPKTVGSRT